MRSIYSIFSFQMPRIFHLKNILFPAFRRDFFFVDAFEPNKHNFRLAEAKKIKRSLLLKKKSDDLHERLKSDSVSSPVVTLIDQIDYFEQSLLSNPIGKSREFDEGKIAELKSEIVSIGMNVNNEELLRQLEETTLKLYWHYGDFDRAHELIDKLGLSNTEVEAMSFLMQGEFSKAHLIFENVVKKMYRDAIITNNTCHPVKIQLAVSLCLVSEHEKALQILKEITPSLDKERFFSTPIPETLAAIYNSLVISINIGLADEVSGRYKQCLFLLKNNPEVLCALGLEEIKGISESSLRFKLD